MPDVEETLETFRSILEMIAANEYGDYSGAADLARNTLEAKRKRTREELEREALEHLENFRRVITNPFAGPGIISEARDNMLAAAGRLSGASKP